MVKQNAELRILIIGTLPPFISGTTILLQGLVEKLRKRKDLTLTVINTAKTSGGLYGSMTLMLRTLWSVFWAGKHADVISFHINEPQNGIPIWLVSRLLRKPIVLRWFGGTDYRTYGSVIRKLCAKWLIRKVDANLFETRALVHMSMEDGARKVSWYPNSRDLLNNQIATISHKHACQKFVFLGHVNRVKGVLELIEAAAGLPPTTSVDFYGPFTGDLSEEEFAAKKNLSYRGVVAPDEVHSTLQQYDALVLPTYHLGEGYPGVIIEAYAAGLPVICTRWQALSEIVDETSGILVPPHDAYALLQAMKTLQADEELFESLCQGALAKSKEFDSGVWADRFVAICRELHNAY